MDHIPFDSWDRLLRSDGIGVLAPITQDELHAALRGAGVASSQDVEAVVLETDGSISVVQRPDDAGADAPSLKRVAGYRSASN